MIKRMAGNHRSGRHHLGPRDVVTARLAAPVLAAVDALAAQHGIDRSPYLADVICVHVGRPDLMRWLDQALLALIATRNTLDHSVFGADHDVTVRVPVPVRQAVEAAAAEHGVSRSMYLADVICAHVGRPDLIRRLNKEVVPLAM